MLIILTRPNQHHHGRRRRANGCRARVAARPQCVQSGIIEYAPFEAWPNALLALLSRRNFDSAARLQIVIFLWSNGVQPSLVADLGVALRSCGVLCDGAALVNWQSILSRCETDPEYRSKLHAFDIVDGHTYYLDGRIKYRGPE